MDTGEQRVCLSSLRTHGRSWGGVVIYIAWTGGLERLFVFLELKEWFKTNKYTKKCKYMLQI